MVTFIFMLYKGFEHTNGFQNGIFWFHGHLIRSWKPCYYFLLSPKNVEQKFSKEKHFRDRSTVKNYVGRHNFVSKFYQFSCRACERCYSSRHKKCLSCQHTSATLIFRLYKGFEHISYRMGSKMTFWDFIIIIIKSWKPSYYFLLALKI